MTATIAIFFAAISGLFLGYVIGYVDGWRDGRRSRQLGGLT